ncbi:MAG: hypothetical protein DRI77_06945 [Chloroflexi bacterium]|nr:MAG: hypothetical protein DRI77_06945 [Chloroflexota bacterium]
MSEEPKKGAKLLAFWLFGTVVIVFAAITAYIMMFAGPAGGIFTALKAGFPIWGITALAAIVIYAVYYFYDKSKS